MGLIFAVKHRKEIEYLKKQSDRMTLKTLIELFIREYKEECSRDYSHRQNRVSSPKETEELKIMRSANTLLLHAYKGDKEVIKGLSDALNIDVAKVIQEIKGK